MKYLLTYFILLLAICQSTVAKPMPIQPLTADQAFQVSGTARDNQTILVQFKIAPGYYLYRDRFRFNTTEQSQAKLSPALYPSGSFNKAIAGLGSAAVYQQSVTIIIPVLSSAQQTLPIQVHYQGCSEQGFCYPPMSKVIPVNLASDYMTPAQGIDVDVTPVKTPSNHIVKVLNNDNILLLIAGFFVFGVLISLTPCVLPMIPILSSIIVGRGKISHLHSFLLSLAYVMGMAITYAIAGLLFALLGGSVQSWLQQPWIIVLFTLLFLAMALSLFGCYNIQLPKKLRNTMAHLSEHQKRGSYVGVVFMGIFSTLILSPCVTPPLVAVLGYVSQSGSAVTGFTALLAMGIGMGVPLLLIGVFGPKILPHRGPWMNVAKSILGFLMLGVAIWMIQRILPDSITILLWAALAIGAAMAMGALSTARTHLQRLYKIIGLILFFYGILLVVGAFQGNSNPLRPLDALSPSKQHQSLRFIPVKTLADVKQQLSLSQHQGKPVLLDFYADWCIACKELDATTFSNTQVKQYLSRFVLLRADVTANDKQDKILERHFNVVAPPTILLFDPQHKEIQSARIIGALSANAFLKHLRAYF